MTIRVGWIPSTLGAIGLACGRRVYLDRTVSKLPPSQIAEVLGHELAHLAQQRRGRVSADRCVAGYAINADRRLEAEAGELGLRFACGDRVRRPRRPATGTTGAPVIQRLVQLEGRPLASRVELAPAVSSVVEMIRGAGDWLDWAVADPVEQYSFASTSGLVEGVQSGLHGSPWALLSKLGLKVSPVRLLELDPADVSVLASNESAKTGVASARQLKKILSEYQLVAQDEIQVGLDFLDEMGVRSSPVFQALDLADEIALFQLVDRASTEATLDQQNQKEASNFAVGKAQHPLEFVDFYRFYMAFLEQGDAGGSAKKRSGAAGDLLNLLTRAVYGHLKCPVIDHAPSLDELSVVLRRWLMATGSVGFSRLSIAVAEVFSSGGLTDSSDDAAKSSVRGFVERAQTLLSETAPRGSTVAQDGGSRCYTVESDAGRAVLRWQNNGSLTLESFSSAPVTPADTEASPGGA